MAVFGLLCLFLAATATTGFLDFFHADRNAQPHSLKVDVGNLNGAPTVESTKIAPDLLRRLPAQEAIKLNLERPSTRLTVTPASPFFIGSADLLNRARAVDCLAAAVYYEAANEPYDGQTAVAQVVLNRLRSPLYPHSVCEVVFQGSHLSTGCQFSFTCDGSLRRIPTPDGLRRARAIAEAALSGQVNARVGRATHYHADYVLPYWAPKLVKLQTIGRHIFYGWPDLWNKPSLFVNAYVGNERGLPMGERGAPAIQLADKIAPHGEAQPIPVKERPVIFGGAAASSVGANGELRPSENRWVLMAPQTVD